MLKPRHWYTLVLVLICSTSQAGTNSWTSTGPEGGPIASAAFHPSDDTAMVVGSARGVHLSLTTGAFWARMFEGDINDIGTVVFDPSHEGRVYAMGNSLYRSDDDARTFGRAYPFSNLRSLALARDGVLYVLDIDGRTFRSGDAGANWSQLTVPWGASWPGNIAVDPSHSNVVYAAFRGVGLYRSLDSGATWQPPLATGPGTRDEFDIATRVVVDPTDGMRLLAATYDGLMHSEDGGANWATRLPGWQIAWIGFDPITTTDAVAMDRYGQIFRSQDGGATWPTNLYSPRMPVHESYSLALSPLHAGRMLAATSEGPMYSEDGGATFQRKVTNLATGTVVSLSSADDGSVYAAMRYPSGIFTRSGSAWYPVNIAPLLDSGPGAAPLRQAIVSPQNSSILYAIDMGGRFMRSVNAGQSWIGPYAGFTGHGDTIAQIAVDPDNPRVVYAATVHTGLWRSADGGVSFEARTAGLPELVERIAVSPANSSVLYVVAQISLSTKAVFRSTDAGINWVQAAAPPDGAIYGMTLDPVNPDVVYLVHDSRLSRSMNGGASWSSIEFGLPASLDTYFSGNALVIDPVYPNTLVTSAYQPHLGFLRSVDGGATWQSTPLNLGGVHTQVHSLALNPQRPGLIVAGVAFGGIHEYEVSPDLGVTLSGLGPKVAAGGSASLHVAVQNYGPHAASAARVTLSFPEFLTLTPPANCVLLAQVLNCDLASMPVGTIRTIDLTLNVNATPASGFIRADLTGHEPDSAGGNNVAISGTLSEPQSDLGVTLSAPSSVTVGKSTSFVATVTNNGPHASPGTHLEVALPGGVFAVSASTTAGTCVGNGSVLTTYKCELGTMNSGGTAAVTVTVRGDVAATYTIDAEVVGLNTDASAANDEASTSFKVNPEPQESKGGGGGGSFDWLMLLLLGSVLAWRKMGTSLFFGKIGMSPFFR